MKTVNLNYMFIRQKLMEVVCYLASPQEILQLIKNERFIA